MKTPLLEAKNLCVQVRSGGDLRSLLKNVSLSIHQGEIYGLVGASGSGKSTLGRALLCLPRPSSGSVYFNGNALTSLSSRQLIPLRQEMQLIFQDPYSALNPQMNVQCLVGEGLEIHGIGNKKERKERVDHFLNLVGLSPEEYAGRYPKQLSGGQRQRVCIARALAVEPKFIVCDEPLTALDVTLQMEIVELLCALKEKLGLSLLFISHNMHLVRKIADRMGTMREGVLSEEVSVD